MLSPEASELLTRVGRGTPLGEMMRRYWHPIALSTQVAEPDGPPLRTKLLGQRFVVFRDTAGRVGVLDEMCMHRGVSLALGRNEAGGLRCLYHGWKFAVDGTILETPNHADCRFRERMKAPAYPVCEQAGLIWAYIGPKELEPPFRRFQFDLVPESNRTLYRANTKASWLPLWEGGLDTSHAGILHSNLVRPDWNTPGDAAGKLVVNVDADTWKQLAPTYEIEDTDFGFQYCAFRSIPGQAGQRHNARLTPAIMPYMRIIPGKTEMTYVLEVPLDDFETATYLIVYSLEGPIDRDFWTKILGYDHPLYDPVTCDFKLEWDNRLGQDRSSMRTSWTGYRGIELEDFAMSVSLGTDPDRTRENLVTSDLAIVRLRRRVLEAIRRFQSGEPPPGVDTSDMTKVIGYDEDIEVSDSWQALAPDNRSRVAVS